MPTLSLCIIAKDEEENLRSCLKSVRPFVNEVVVIDTGSVDRTRQVAESFGAKVYDFDRVTNPGSFYRDTEEENSKWRGPPPYSGDWCLGDFAAAREESFRRATGDYLVWMDADDVLENGHALGGCVASMAAVDAPMCYLAYNYAQDHLGRTFYRQWRERIIRRGAANWINPVHEVLMQNSPFGVPPPRFDAPVYCHRRKADRKSVPHRNLKILLRQVWQRGQDHPEAPADPRVLFYLGQESRYVDPMKSISYFEEYLHSSGWPEERAAAHCVIGQILEAGVASIPYSAAMTQASREYAMAAAEMPDNPDGLLGLARIAYFRNRWSDCIRYSEAAFKVGNTDTMLGSNPMDRIYRPHVYYNFALNTVGRVEEALASCRLALEAVPDDPGIVGGASGMLSANAKLYDQHLRR